MNNINELARRNILCVCPTGIVRGVTLAWVLRVMYGADAIPIPICLSPPTLNTMYQWADTICVATEGLYGEIPAPHIKKTHIIPIGDDVWKQPLHPELVKWVTSYVVVHEDELNLKGALSAPYSKLLK